MQAQTIVDLDDLLESSDSSDIRTTLGVWAAQGFLHWDQLQYTALFLGIHLPVRKIEEPCLPLLHWMIDFFLQMHGPANTLYVWKAQQAYRIIQLTYSVDQQENILCRLRKMKKISRSLG
jgi:hypothetical protein